MSNQCQVLRLYNNYYSLESSKKKITFTKTTIPVKKSTMHEDLTLAAKDIGEQTKKTRGPNREYKEIYRFPDYESATQHMRDNITSYHHRYNKDTLEGNKQYYSCNGFDKCPKTMFVLLHSTSLDCSIWESTANHNHQAKETKLPKLTVELVKKCLRDGLKSNQTILNKIEDQMLPKISVMQLNNLKARLRDQSDGTTNSAFLFHASKAFSQYSTKQITIGKIRRRGIPRLTVHALDIPKDEFALSDENLQDKSPKEQKAQANKRKATVLEPESEHGIIADDDLIMSSNSKKSKVSDSSKLSPIKSVRKSTRIVKNSK